MSIIFGRDPIDEEVTRVLAILERGEWDHSESQRVDLKEEAGRRDREGNVLPGQPENDRAAEQVAHESACMANTPGGGALILGAADDGSLIGTRLEVEWLRQRVFELTNRQMTLAIRQVDLSGTRLLVIRPPEAVEPIRWKGRVTWRVNDRCEEVDLATWHSRKMMRTHFDWSAQSSTVPLEEVRSTSVEIARQFLRASTEAHAVELSQRPTVELLTRLNVVDGEGRLTNAGVLAFVGRESPCLDYVRRPFAGADSSQRVRRGNRSILEELQEVMTYIAAGTSIVHLPGSTARGQVPELPEVAIREALVNGLAHREWGSTDPTVVEHVGRTLRVTSPGGFYGGVNASNIITHPSRSRNRSLTELFAALRIAEREGIGVDRMIGAMLKAGHRPPTIEELEGPYVRASLAGDSVDISWIQWLSQMEPTETASDLNSLLLLDEVVRHGWFDTSTAESILQLGEAEVTGAINRLHNATVDSAPVIQLVRGIPDEQNGAWHLSRVAHAKLEAMDKRNGTTRSWPGRQRLAMSYAIGRGRISTTELGALTFASPSNIGSVLRELEENGQLVPSRENRRGAGFFYRPAPGPNEQ